jgi:capsular polysaccharide biosynthesis protein
MHRLARDLAEVDGRCGVSYRQLREPETIDHPPPLHLPGDEHRRFAAGSLTVAAHGVATIEGGRVHHTAIATSDGILIGPLSPRHSTESEAYLPRDDQPLLGAPLPPTRHLPGTALHLAVAGGSGYYHTIIEVFARWLLVDGWPGRPAFDHVIVNSALPLHVRQALALFGLGRLNVVETAKDPHLSADLLVVPTPLDHGVTPRWLVEGIRRTVGPQGGGTGTRFWVERGATAHRRLANPAPVHQAVTRRGFSLVDFDVEDYGQTAGTLARAEIMAGVHGAGLANCAMVPDGATVVDVMHPFAVSTLFWSLASAAGHRFAYLLGAGERAPDRMDNVAYLGHDVEVPVDRLEALLELM